MTCIECPKTDRDPTFQFYGGLPHQGPAYWSDKGMLCGPACATRHFQRRIADGTFVAQPFVPLARES